MYEYRAKAVRVVDGDTVYFEVDVGFKTKMTHSMRLLGIDTPEIRGGTDESKAKGQLAKAALMEKLGMDLEPEKRPPLVVKTHKNPDSFGRYLAIAYICGDVDEGAENVNQWMLDEGYAGSYVKRSKRKKP